MSELGLKLIKDRFTKPGRDVANYTGDGAANRILSILGADDALVGQGRQGGRVIL